MRCKWHLMCCKFQNVSLFTFSIFSSSFLFSLASPSPIYKISLSPYLSVGYPWLNLHGYNKQPPSLAQPPPSTVLAGVTIFYLKGLCFLVLSSPLVAELMLALTPPLVKNPISTHNRLLPGCFTYRYPNLNWTQFLVFFFFKIIT